MPPIDIPALLASDTFDVSFGVFCGEPACLIQPNDIKSKFNIENLHLRSCVTDTSGHIISQGFTKFFNYTEKPDLYPDPNKYNDWIFLNKEDGSTCVCDYHNNIFSMRTRGQFNYEKMENKEEFDILPAKYPKLIDFIKRDGGQHSFLLEMTTPNNRIVLYYTEVNFTLLAVINKTTLQYLSFKDTKQIAEECGIKTPEIFEFKNKSLPEISAAVKEWKGKEGLVLCYNNYQNRIKIKSDDYLFKHRIKGKLNSTENLIDFFISKSCPGYSDFVDIITTEIDYETSQELKGKISNLVDAHKEIQNIIESMKSFINSTNSLTRKDFAARVLSSYGTTNRASFVFTLKDRKVLSADNIKKLLFQALKK